MTYAVDASGPFYHGTRADLSVGDLLAPGFSSNMPSASFPGSTSPARSTRRSGAASWPKGKAASGSTSPSRPANISTTPISPTRNEARSHAGGHGEHCSPGNPIKSYRSREPLRIVGEVTEWEGHPPERLKEMKDFLAKLEAEGDMQIID
jgi:Rifampin ADP-ribosyl transferase